MVISHLLLMLFKVWGFLFFLGDVRVELLWLRFTNNTFLCLDPSVFTKVWIPLYLRCACTQIIRRNSENFSLLKRFSFSFLIWRGSDRNFLVHRCCQLSCWVRYYLSCQEWTPGLWKWKHTRFSFWLGLLCHLLWSKIFSILSSYLTSEFSSGEMCGCAIWLILDNSLWQNEKKRA